MERLFAIFFALVLIVGVASIGEAAPAPQIKGVTVEYSAGGVVMKGYLAYDENIHGKRPGVLVVHEWWGLNDYARKRAEMLAELGYAALALDMYGGKVATHPSDAQKFAAEIRGNFDLTKVRFLAGMDFLKAQPVVDPARIAAIGYCFGGGIVLNMARERVDLTGVVSFHGGLAPVKPAHKGAVKARILVLHGEADATSTPEQVAAFKQEMEAAGVDYRFVSYPGAKHAFTNPEADAVAQEYNLPIGYDADADKQSWKEMRTFLTEIFAE
jgi:dienelactone hydrolase